MKKLIIIGASGHGKVLLDIALANDYKVLGFLDDSESIKEVLGYPVLGKVETAHTYDDVEFIIGIGNNSVRKRVAEMLEVSWATLIHPNAVVSRFSKLGVGTVVMPWAIINPGSTIGKHVILNTASIIEHDNVISNYVHISVKAALAGSVNIGECSQVSIGATVKNNISICENVMVGAGAVVVKNIEKAGVYVGIPAVLMNR